MRCYNGQPDKQLQALLDDSMLCDKQLAEFKLRATYFPLEGKWMVFNRDHKPVTDFYDSKRVATNVALQGGR